MKKKFLATLLLSGMVLSVGTGALAAPLTDADKTDANQGTAADYNDPSNPATNFHKETTDVEVKLGDKNPIDPTTGPYFKRLAIAYKPAAYKFEGSVGATALVNKVPKKERQHIAVNDDRRISEADDTYLNGNWKLTGQLSDLKNAKGDKLTGVMNFETTTPTKYYIGKEVTKTDVNGVVTVDYDVEEPTWAEDPAETAAYNIEPKFDLKVGGDDAVNFLSKVGKLTDFSHDGTGVDKTGNRGVQTSLGNAELSLPTQAAADGDYSGFILWTLSAAL